MTFKNNLFLLISYFLVFLTIFSSCNSNKKPTYKIAYVGRYTGLNDNEEQRQRSLQFNLMHEYNLKKYVEKHNIDAAFELQLEIFDNYKNSDSTQAVFQRIVNDPSIIGVIDNSWGAELEGAQELISTHDIPMIAINGDMNELDYGSSIFTGNSDDQIEDIVIFLQKGLKSDTINFISEENYKLHTKYITMFAKYGITISNHIYVPSNQIDTAYINEQTILQSIDNNYPVVLNTHADIGSKVINTINKLAKNKQIIGHASVISHNSIHKFKKNNRLVILSQSESAVPKDVAQDISLFKHQYPEVPFNFNSALYFQRCKNAWSILNSSIEMLEEPISRKGIANELAHLHDNSLYTKDDILSFTETGSMIRESSFVEYGPRGEHAFSIQLNTHKKVIPNMSFGIEIIDIQNVDLNTNSFGADFYYWITSDSSFSDIEDYITFQNIKPSESEVELISEKKFNNLNYRLYKVSGIFLEKFNESNYPFDNQEISINIQILNTAERLRVSFDNESFHQKMNDFSLKGWKQNEFYVTVDNTVTDHLKGNLELTENTINKFKNISFRLKIERSKLPGLLQIVLPLFFIGILANGLLFLKKLAFSEIGEPLAAVFLTIIAFSISLSDITPTGDILTKTDLLFILTLITVVLCFLLGLLHNVHNGIGETFIKRSRLILSVSYIILFWVLTLTTQ